MPKAEARPEAKEEKAGRKDTVRPPAGLPDGTPFERMAELTRRLVAVTKEDVLVDKERSLRKRRPA
jgi:hypothetical protein